MLNNIIWNSFNFPPYFLTEACKFDFENGLHGWEKTGTAFNNQPTYGDNPTARNRGQPAKQQGDWWIGGAEDRPSNVSKAGLLQGDRPQGTITSPPFKIMGSTIAFLIGGGCDINSVRAELIVNNKVRIMNVNTFEWVKLKRKNESEKKFERKEAVGVSHRDMKKCNENVL